MSVSTKHLDMFIKFAAKELKLDSLPKIHFVGNEEDKYDAFGHKQGGEIHVRITDRHPIDIMRTIAHELVHFNQKKGNVNSREDNANMMAGRIMRKFDIRHPEVFKDKPIKSVNEDGVAANAVGAGGMGSSSPGPIQGLDPIMGSTKRKSIFPERTRIQPLKKMQVSKKGLMGGKPLSLSQNGAFDQFKMNSTKYNHVMPSGGPKNLRDIIGRENKNIKRSDKR